jgi:hypothetical protein
LAYDLHYIRQPNAKGERQEAKKKRGEIDMAGKIMRYIKKHKSVNLVCLMNHVLGSKIDGHLVRTFVSYLEGMASQGYIKKVGDHATLGDRVWGE